MQQHLRLERQRHVARNHGHEERKVQLKQPNEEADGINIEFSARCCFLVGIPYEAALFATMPRQVYATNIARPCRLEA